MFNQASYDEALSRRFGPGFSRPEYNGYAFSQLPQTIRSLLIPTENRGVPIADQFYDRENDRVILFFIDAFGWRFLERYQDHPFLRRIYDNGEVNVISSQFPSTTAAHVTTIHTGLPVGESGIYEWFYYEPEIDEIIAPLLYSFAGDENRDTLLAAGLDPSAIFPTHTLYQELATSGIRSTVIQDSRYTDSPYTSAVTNGARLVPYKSLPEAIATLYELIEAERAGDRSYYFLYYDKIDAVSHEHGPTSLQVDAEITMFLDTMEKIFEREMVQVHGRTLFLMTADHGHVEIDPATTHYLNLELPELLPMLKRNRRGDILAPAGSTRDMFLHTKPEHTEEAIILLRMHLNGLADVCATSDLMEAGFFGTVTDELRKRIGDLVILPYAGESVWWFEEGRFRQKHYGSHGGLSYQEMETVLLIKEYGS